MNETSMHENGMDGRGAGAAGLLRALAARLGETPRAKRRSCRGRQRGFTLIEILIVMAILGMLAALVVPNLMGTARGARVKTTRLQIASLGTALDQMALDTGRYPTSQEGLRALLDAPSGMEMWDGPYLKKLPKDAWNRDFVYRQNGSEYEILSYGADGSPGGDGDNADITNND